MEITQEDQNRLTLYYKQSLLAHGPGSAKSLHWLTKEDQKKRFQTLCRIGSFSGKSVLDVGCGLGDLYHHLAGYDTNFNYLGIDILPDMVKQARLKYPRANFMMEDIFNIEPDQFNYVLASGALTFNVSGGRDFYYNMIAQMYKIAKHALAFNMLEDVAYTTDEYYLAYNRNEITEVCKQLTNRYYIVGNYLQGDFSVFLYKGDR